MILPFIYELDVCWVLIWCDSSCRWSSRQQGGNEKSMWHTIKPRKRIQREISCDCVEIIWNYYEIIICVTVLQTIDPYVISDIAIVLSVIFFWDLNGRVTLISKSMYKQKNIKSWRDWCEGIKKNVWTLACLFLFF